MDDNPIAWVEEHGWYASIRIAFKTGPVPTEWHGDAAEWAMNYSLKPSVNEALDCIKSANVLLMDMTVRKARKRQWFRWRR